MKCTIKEQQLFFYKCFSKKDYIAWPCMFTHTHFFVDRNIFFSVSDFSCFGETAPGGSSVLIIEKRLCTDQQSISYIHDYIATSILKLCCSVPTIMCAEYAKYFLIPQLTAILQGLKHDSHPHYSKQILLRLVPLISQTAGSHRGIIDQIAKHNINIKV